LSRSFIGRTSRITIYYQYCHCGCSDRTYPGLDITAGVLPFFRRVEGAGVEIDSEDVFCRLLRLVEVIAFVDSVSGSGLASRAGAFRFRDGGRVDRSGDAIEVADVPGDVSEDPTCLADARVTLEDMSISLTGMIRLVL
jgi:hypothetical protein